MSEEASRSIRKLIQSTHLSTINIVVPTEPTASDRINYELLSDQTGKTRSFSRSNVLIVISCSTSEYKILQHLKIQNTESIRTCVRSGRSPFDFASISIVPPSRSDVEPTAESASSVTETRSNGCTICPVPITRVVVEPVGENQLQKNNQLENRMVAYLRQLIHHQ